MSITHIFSKSAAAALAIALAAGAAFAAEGFVGKYETTDSEGKPFTIWLSDNGSAKGDRANEGLQGMWKEEGSAAVITWDTNWVTTITKDGDAYKKSATKDGKAVGSPADAKKVE
jgi:hypothetical protein